MSNYITVICLIVLIFGFGILYIIEVELIVKYLSPDLYQRARQGDTEANSLLALAPLIITLLTLLSFR